MWLSEDQENGAETNIIDSTIVEGNDGRYYRFSTSDWNTIVDVSDTLAADDVFDVSVNADESTPDGSWTRLVKRDGQSEAGFSRVKALQFTSSRTEPGVQWLTTAAILHI